MCRHTKHFTRGFQWRVFRVNVHVCASKAPEECVHVCVCVCRMTRPVVWNLTRGACWIHEGPLSCPPFFPIRCQGLNRPRSESSASLCQIFTRLLKNIKHGALWSWMCGAYVLRVSIKRRRPSTENRHSVILFFLIPSQISARLIRARAASASP